MQHKFFKNALAWTAGAFILLVILWTGEWISSWRSARFDTQEDVPTSGSVDVYVRNLSQTGSHYEKNPAYGKGEMLEFAYFITPDNATDFLANFAKLKGLLDTKSVTVNDREVPLSVLDQPFTGSGNTVVKIRGQARLPSVQENAESDSVTVEFTGKKPVTRKEERRPGPAAQTLTIVDGNYRADQNVAIRIVGNQDALNAVRYVNIGGKSFPAIVGTGSAYAVVERGNFSKGDYFAGAYMNDGTLVPVDGKVTFVSEGNPVSIATIVPNRVPGSRDTYVVLQGNGFAKMISLQLSNSLILKNASFSITSDQVAIVKIPKGLSPGSYQFNLMDTRGIYSTDSTELTVY